MRVPIPIVILLVILAGGGTWWYGTRDKDFLTPPTERELAVIRERVKASIPEPDRPEEALSVPAAPVSPLKPPAEEEKAIPLGSIGTPPRLDEYAGSSSRGADRLMTLALALETEGEFQRALLAWERVIDMGKADETRIPTAITAVQRLRPTLPDWNTDSEKAIPVVLHAGTDERAAEALEPALAETVRRIERASGGILKVSHVLNTSRGEIASSGVSPVALWLAGPGEDMPTTEVISFTPSEGADLEAECARALFGMIRAYLVRNTTLDPIPPIGDGGNVKEALVTHVTRLAWRDLGVLLNRKPKSEDS